MPFELQFASFANFSSRGQNEESRKSRSLCGQVKAGNSGTLESLAVALAGNRADEIRGYISRDRYLVPIPGSGKTSAENLWAPKLICEALTSTGIGAGCLPILKRVTGVPKSAFAKPGERPPPSQHFETMAADVDLTTPLNLTLVDDVLTKGSTAIGAALRIKQELPNADILVFSVFKTCNFLAEIEQCVDPSTGRIVYQQELNSAQRID